MKSDKLLILNRIALIILIVTFVLWSILLIASVKYDSTHDDIFGASFTVQIGLILLLIVIAEESCVYFALRYFLMDPSKRTKAKTIIHGLLLLVCVVVLLMQLLILL